MTLPDEAVAGAAMNYDRLDRIEAILREYQMHEPSCPARETEKANRSGGVYWLPESCTCWLAS